MLLRKCKNIFEILVVKERCPKILSKSFCMGVYIAFSPFVFCHTVMAFIFTWAFSLNLAGVFAGSLLINNPWTMVPVYASGYLFGQFFLGGILGINTLHLNPSWMKPLNTLISHYTGIQGISFWSFLIGGNLLGIIFGGMLYPIVKYMIKKIATEGCKNKPSRNITMVKYENNCQK